MANLRSQGLYGPKWGTIRSGVTPGSRQDGQNPEIPENSENIPEKRENFGKSWNLHVTYQMKAIGALVCKDIEIPVIQENYR